MLALHPRDGSEPSCSSSAGYPQHWTLHHHTGLFERFHHTHATFLDPELQAEISWTSRRHRKGRRVKVAPTAEGHTVARHFPRLWGWEWGNISWWVAQFFVWGSVVWCVQGCFAFIPLSNTKLQAYVTGYLALLGGTLFEVGAYCMILEALNIRNTVRFGFEVKHLVDGEFKAVFHPVEGSGHYGRHDKGSPGSSSRANMEQNGSEGGSRTRQKWMWWGYRRHSLGYVAAVLTFTGATIFWISTITGVPNVMPEEDNHYVLWDILYWLPQVLGGCFFIIAPVLLMLETQKKWWQIKPLNVGWQVAFWNFVGGCGFFVCGIFGFWAYPSCTKQHYGTAFSTFWGSWAFLIGSYMQLFEMLN